jgi:hypothetical protein
VRLEEAVLHGVLGLATVAEHVAREREQPGVVPLEQLAEGVAAASSSCARQDFVRLPPAQSSHRASIVQYRATVHATREPRRSWPVPASNHCALRASQPQNQADLT